MSAQDDHSHQASFRSAPIDRIKALLSSGRTGPAVSRTSAKPNEAPSQGLDMPLPQTGAQASAADDRDVTRLCSLVRTDLTGADVIAVSNRETDVPSTQVNGKAAVTKTRVTEATHPARRLGWGESRAWSWSPCKTCSQIRPAPCRNIIILRKHTRATGGRIS